MNDIISVATGEVKVGYRGHRLTSNAIGSCIVVAAINLEKPMACLAHILLPGKAPSKEKHQTTKYAVDAIDRLLNLMQSDDATASKLIFCLVGAANVLQKKDDTICESNIQSVLNILNAKRLKISATALGGILRRSVRIDIENNKVYFTKGDSKEKLLWSSGKS